MIKKAHYTQLSLLILLLFALFQITSISISFDEITNKLGGHKSGNNIERITTDASESILLITGEQTKSSKQIERGLLYLRKGYRVNENLLNLSAAELKKVEVIILASPTMSGVYDIDLIRNYINQGIDIIMAVLPPREELSEEWQALLGIKSIGGVKEQKGITVLSGFLLGGKHDYKDYLLDIRDIRVASTCKTYIAGMGDEDNQNVPNNDMAEDGTVTDILWRNVYKGSQIFTVNGAFFNNNDGFGILTAVFSELYPDFIYPVINAKALLVNNAPYLSNENDTVMLDRYARNSKQFFEDIAMPQIIALCMSFDSIPTFYAVSSMDQSIENKGNYNISELSIANSELNRIGGQLGISLYDRNGMDQEKKVINMLKLCKAEQENYNFNSIYLKNFDQTKLNSLIDKLSGEISVKSLITSWKEGSTFSFYKDDIIQVPTITEGFYYSDNDLFAMDTAAVAYGVEIHGIDMEEILYPKSDKDDWAVAYRIFASYMDTYWTEYQFLDSINMTGVYNRVVSYLTITPNITMEEDHIGVAIEGFLKQAYFILRTDKGIKDVTNGTFTKIEEGVYLISAEKEIIDIIME